MAWRGACFIASALLLEVPGSAGNAAVAIEESAAVRRLTAISVGSSGGADGEDYDDLLAMIEANNKEIVPLKSKVVELVEKGEYGESAKVATRIKMLKDQNARNQALRDEVQDTKRATDMGLYTLSDELFRDVVREKCRALTATRTAELKIDLKAAIEAAAEDLAEADRIIGDIVSLDGRCEAYADAMALVAEEGSIPSSPSRMLQS